jgi:2'-5' RNA ligase
MKSIYDEMWNNSLEAFREDKFEFDPLIDNPDDLRRGITLQAKPGKDILAAFKKFIDEIRKNEPDQYFYKPGEIHITVMSIINCIPEFSLSKINLHDYIKAIEKCLKNIGDLKIKFSGITASPSCILIQGFQANNSLQMIRNNLRSEIKGANLYNSIDKRYQIKTSHCTVIRFKEELRNKDKFVDFLKDYREYYFGDTSINELELVFTDWYHKQEIVKVLHKFKLNY